MLDNVVEEINGVVKNGCGRFPIGGNQSQRNNVEQKKPMAHSPSPDRLSNGSDNSQYIPQPQSLSLLPHPRPKHNLREQLLWSTAATQPSSNYQNIALKRTSPNFPQPTSNSVAMRISALEKCVPLQINAQLGSTSTQTAPMSPRSTVFRTKPVLHMQMDENNKQIYASTLKVC